MAPEPKNSKKKSNLLEIKGKLAKAKLVDGKKSGVLPFLNEAAPLISRRLSDYTGTVTLHIQDGELASWESKAGGCYKS